MKIQILLILSVFNFCCCNPLGDYSDNPEINENLFEGDIVLKSANEINDILSKNGFIGNFRRWHKNKDGLVRVPYKIRVNEYNIQDVQLMRSAFDEIEKNSCIRLVPRILQPDYIEVVNDRGCSSFVGRIGGRQIVTLANKKFGANCMQKGPIIHEILHALGFYHMQSSADRDEYLKINFENVQPGAQQNFQKFSSTRFRTDYDYRSVMHYGAYFFSKNGKPTMEPLDKNVDLSELGQRNDMSEGDIVRLNAMYLCGM